MGEALFFAFKLVMVALLFAFIRELVDVLVDRSKLFNRGEEE